MANRANSMFSDRRDSRRGRRKNDLPTPAGLDRRVDSRRTGQFHSGDWWLKVDYADEFVSEKAFAEELKQIKQERVAMRTELLRLQDIQAAQTARWAFAEGFQRASETSALPFRCSRYLKEE